MFNLDLTYDIIDAANAHEDFDKANIRDLADLYNVSEQYVAERIEYTREQIKANPVKKEIATDKRINNQTTGACQREATIGEGPDDSATTC